MTTQKKFAATVGLDWADQKHDLWIQPSDGSKSVHMTLQQSAEAIHEWVAKMRERFGGKPLAICIETSRGPVISALMTYDFLVIYPINPKALKSYRGAFSISGAKDDRTDAMLLEEYVRLHQDKIRALEPDTILTRKLAAMVVIRRDWVDDRTRFVEQLHTTLKTYYPLAETLLGDQLTKPMAADFLSRWPDLESLQKCPPKTIREFFLKHNSRNHKIIDQRLEAIGKARPLTTDLAILDAGRTRLSGLISILKPLHLQIALLEKKIQALMDEHPDAEIFRSLPGAGPCLAPRLLVAFGTNRDRFASAAEVAQFYGVAPVTRQSGTAKSVHLRHRCPKFGRQSFHENAGCAINKEPSASCFHSNYKKRHDNRHHQSNRALAFKLIRIYYACWKNRELYDSNRYMQALEKSSSSIPKLMKEAAAKKCE